MNPNRALEVEFQPSQMPEFVVRDLLEELAALGYDAKLADTPELRGTYDAEPILVWVTEHLSDKALGAITRVVVDWVLRKVGRRRKGQVPPEVRVLYKPDGTVLKRVEIPAPETSAKSKSSRPRPTEECSTAPSCSLRRYCPSRSARNSCTWCAGGSPRDSSIGLPSSAPQNRARRTGSWESIWIQPSRPTGPDPSAGDNRTSSFLLIGTSRTAHTRSS